MAKKKDRDEELLAASSAALTSTCREGGAVDAHVMRYVEESILLQTRSSVREHLVMLDIWPGDRPARLRQRDPLTSTSRAFNCSRR